MAEIARKKIFDLILKLLKGKDCVLGIFVLKWYRVSWRLILSNVYSMKLGYGSLLL